jgi:hypothetical protein
VVGGEESMRYFGLMFWTGWILGACWGSALTLLILAVCGHLK